MYRRPKFLETLLKIRREMAREADNDVAVFAEMARTGGERFPRQAAEPDSAAAEPVCGSVRVVERSEQAVPSVEG